MSDASAATAIRYRADIDGLRAIAVVGVIAYHFGVPGCGGGFVGVDMFFVISGYLITGIIAAQIQRGDFSYLGFYNRRIRRILPALYVVMLATLAFGSATLLPSDLVYLGKSAVSTLLFSSNLFFWKTSGYFDGGHAINTLLHTWSLAVEEQFYIVFPVFLLLAFRHLRAHLRSLLWIGAVASFLACVWLQQSHATATFYLAPFRAWELVLGALLAIGACGRPPSGPLREVAAGVGLALLGYGLTATLPGPDFPGWRAAIPAIGTALLIHSGSAGDSLIGRMLASRVLVATGLISYSLYLWHWPIHVYLNVATDGAPSPMARLFALTGVAVAAALSYRFVERPFRRMRATASPVRVVCVAAVLSGLLVGAGSYLVRSAGMPWRYAPIVDVLDHARDPAIPFVECMDRHIGAAGLHGLCTIGAQGVAPTAIVWGDSHALAWAPALDGVLRAHGVAAVFAALSSCAPLVGVSNRDETYCHAHSAEVMRELAHTDRIGVAILIASWPSYASDQGRYTLQGDAGQRGNAAVFASSLRNTIEQLEVVGKRVWLLGPTPHLAVDVPYAMAVARVRDLPLPAALPDSEFAAQTAAYRNALATLRPGPHLHVSEPGDWLCRGGACRYEDQGLPLFRDNGHLNERGAAFLQPALDRAWLEFIASGVPHDAR